ncbi:uncharacterized protein BDZ99DRAFT_500521 [Mytilinidion resinicola]|uniref:BZIP domain-containing protein n=1 Tax=Mytilinidion resinicola TaxID=574789 RepID=A0A6A6YEL8_9PEZI|nr:uncharacterized protein BDZ99DRAFT_500521 [Mytilinidion resinicola]KAF2807272.1 hypothetical protein BDZ99DRAFT_500521 [Mytilinidion resinicola]
MSADKSGVEKVLDGSLFGYGHWFEPIDKAFGTTLEPQPQPGPEASSEPVEKPKGRGRPRKSRNNDDAAREKRRAQIRSAQKTYRERKERATASQEQRCDELLRVISDISAELEELLQVACATGAIDRNDALGEKLRHTASCYDSAIERPCIDPKLRLLRTKSRQKRENNRPDTLGPPTDDEATPQPQSSPTRRDDSALSTLWSWREIPHRMDLDLGRVSDSSLIQSFRPHPGRKTALGAKTMLDLIKQRQADLKAGRPSQPVTAKDIEFTQRNSNGDLGEPLKFGGHGS